MDSIEKLKFENGMRVDNPFGVPPLAQLFRILDEEEELKRINNSDVQCNEETLNSLSTEADDDDEDEDGDEDDDGREEKVGEQNTDCRQENKNDCKKKRILKKCEEALSTMGVSKEEKNRGLEIVKDLFKSVDESKFKKSVRSLTAGFMVIVSKKLCLSIDVKKMGRIIPRTDRHFKLSQPSSLSLSTDAVCISRIASSLEKKSNDVNNNKNNNKNNNYNNNMEPSHFQSTMELTEQLSEKMGLNQVQKDQAIALASQSEHPSLASRHALSIAAASVSIASKLSVNSVAKVSNISATTIRKTITAFNSLI